MKTWRLKKGGDRRLRQGHPWVFASELAHSAKEIAPGEIVELRDFQDHFLAYGYAHPSSQICFRKISSRSQAEHLFDEPYFIERLTSARAHRQMAGWTDFSHRWLFAESDGVSGLIVDAFLTNQGWVVVVQASTAGAEKALPNVFKALKTFEKEMPSMTMIEASNSKTRKLEGLTVGGKKVISGPAKDLEKIQIELNGGVRLSVDLLGGQKTGFFLDQQWNAQLMRRILAHGDRKNKTMRVLDLCCYVGQWAAHATRELKTAGFDVDVTLLDASAGALRLADENVQALGAKVHSVEADVLKSLSDLEPESFDVVICDPPAFVKKKADLELGLKAYVKLNRDALKTLKHGGLFVSCSCSGLVHEAEWNDILSEAALKSGRTLRQLAQGGHGPDHPVRPDFSEGRYLKCSIFRSDRHE